MKEPLESISEIFNLLTENKLPEGVSMEIIPPKMSARQAFGIIWFLQEHIGCLPSNIELCDDCELLFDTDIEGFHLDPDIYNLENGGEYLNLCDGCAQNYVFENKH